jgi:hypothetical protein
MAMTERVRKLRQKSLHAKETIPAKRVMLVAEFSRQNPELISTPEQRALLFQYLMGYKAIDIGEGELIVRVSGYSDFFWDLPRELQGETIAQTGQQGF